MFKRELKLKIVNRILAAIICQDRIRSMSDRMPDIDHSFDVAEEVIRRLYGDGTPAGEYTLEPKPAIKTRETIISRDPPPLRDGLAQRRGQVAGSKRSGPTLH
ncbi:hypothetical protein LDO32_03775 [Luteimonas sp. Y-2-2-4F]|nr:hypothetical protein [Luteimonas sp. Y-2-2-4F]MCD9030853.1 hypothetical protein [Luteimonas sp. Y-2-2-4F]